MKFFLPLPGQPLASVPNQDIYETKESHLRRKFHHLEGFRHPKELHWQLCGGISRCVRGSWRMPSATLEVSLFWCRSQGLQFMISATNFYIVILSAMMIQKCVVLSNRAKTYFLFTGVGAGGGGYDFRRFLIFYLPVKFQRISRPSENFTKGSWKSRVISQLTVNKLTLVFHVSVPLLLTMNFVKTSRRTLKML